MLWFDIVTRVQLLAFHKLVHSNICHFKSPLWGCTAIPNVLLSKLGFDQIFSQSSDLKLLNGCLIFSANFQ